MKFIRRSLKKDDKTNLDDVENLQMKPVDAKKTINKLQNQLNKMSIEISEQKATIQNLENVKEQLEDEKMKLEVEVDFLTNEKQLLEEENENNHRYAMELEDQTTELERDLQELKDQGTCVICMDRRRSIVICPCFHLLSCEKCLDRVMKTFKRCSLCSAKITGSFKIYK